MAYGTLSVLDTLAAQRVNIAAYGEDLVFQGLQQALEAHNRIMQEALDDLCEVTTDRQRRFGGPDVMQMDEVDEFGASDVQKVAAGVTVGFPLRLYQIPVGWTRKYMQNASVAELAAQFIAAQDADVRRVTASIKQAIFTPTNATFTDRLVDRVSLSLKALANADGAALPTGPNGETFNGATHTHYLAVATGGTITVADLTSVIEAVLEHYANGRAMVYINRAQEAAVRGLTGFVAYLDTRIVGQTTAAQAPNLPLDPIQLYNRAIGIFDGAEIWVKPWIPSSYIFAFVAGQQAPLVYRQRDEVSGTLQLAYEDEDYPLRARALEREFGVAVWNRVNGAVLYTAANSYAAPTITP